MYDAASDAELVALALRSDRGAFAALMSRHSRAVFLYAWGVTRNTADAEDVTQDVFVTAWAKLAGIRIVDASVLPWLLVTARNLLANHRRRAFFRTTVELDETIAGAAPETSRHDELQWVLAEIDKLGGLDRRICQLCLVEGYGYAEAAKHLGLSTSAVAKRVERARSALRSAVRGES